jgi:tyrosyl-tRNA synthetase
MGGDDQWGNILAGVDLIRRVEGATVHAMTFPLLTTASGAKMGKTAGGAIWIDGDMLSPYDYYQYWVNCDDRDVERFLKLFTFLPLDEIEKLAALEGAEIRIAKQTLAFKATEITHGTQAAQDAQAAAQAAFGAAGNGVGDLDGMPSTNMPRERLTEGIPLTTLLAETELVSSRGQARRLIQQGGAYVNDQRISDVDAVVGKADLTPEGILLRAGKKRYHRVLVDA